MFPGLPAVTWFHDFCSLAIVGCSTWLFGNWFWRCTLYSVLCQSLLASQTGQMWSAPTLEGEPCETLCAPQNLACLLSPCYNNYRRRWFNRNRRQLQGGSRPVNFAYIYESGFYPHYWVWTLTAPLFGRMEGVDSMSFFGLPSATLSEMKKNWGHRVTIMVPYTPQSFSSISAASIFHIWIFTSPGLQISLDSLFWHRALLGPPYWIPLSSVGPHPPSHAIINSTS